MNVIEEILSKVVLGEPYMRTVRWMDYMKANNIFGNRTCRMLPWLFFAAVLLVIFLNSLNRQFRHDEFEAVHSAWKVLHGETPYVDFFQHHHPLFYYLLAPVIAISGENTATIIVMRMAVFGMLLLIFVVTYRISARVFNKETGVVSLLLLSTTFIFVSTAIEIRPDVPQTLFGLLSVLLLLVYFEDGSTRHLVLSSISLGISFLFLQKTLFLIMLTGGLLFVGVYKKNINYREMMLYPSVFLLTIVPYYIYLFGIDSFAHYVTFGWILNMKFLQHFSPFGIMLSTLGVNSGFFLFYVLGLLFFTKTPNQKRVAFFSLGLLMSVFLVRVPYRQYYLMALPLVAAISAHAVCSIFKSEKGLALVLIALIAVPFFYLSRNARRTNTVQLEEIEYVLSITGGDDYVYDGEIVFNVFRKDIDFFWFSIRPNTHALATYQTMTGYYYNVYESIDRFRPKVISNYYIEDMQDLRIAGHYVQSDVYEDLFIRTR